MRIFSNDVDNALEHMLFLRLLLFPLLLALSTMFAKATAADLGRVNTQNS